MAARYRSHKLDGPLHFHYVAPSFWAWKGGEERLKGLVEFVDHILCILPNEEDVCKSNGLAATFVGHPILEDTLDLNVVRCVLILVHAGCINSSSLNLIHEKVCCIHCLFVLLIDSV